MNKSPTHSSPRLNSQVLKLLLSLFTAWFTITGSGSSSSSCKTLQHEKNIHAACDQIYSMSQSVCRRQLRSMWSQESTTNKPLVLKVISQITCILCHHHHPVTVVDNIESTCVCAPSSMIYPIAPVGVKLGHICACCYFLTRPQALFSLDEADW